MTSNRQKGERKKGLPQEWEIHPLDYKWRGELGNSTYLDNACRLHHNLLF